MADEPTIPGDPLLVPNPQLPATTGEQNLRIRPGSPLAVVGLFVEVIRMRFQEKFAGTGALPWAWDADIKKTKIAIESAYVEDTEHRNWKPGVFVDVDGATYGRTVTGDRAGQNLASGREGFFSLDTQPVLIEVKAAKRGECAIIGDLVRVFLQASSDLIQAKFGLHEMTPVTLGRPMPSQQDKDVFIAPVTFTVQIPARWTSKPSAPLLQELILKIARSGADDATQFFTDIALPPV